MKKGSITVKNTDLHNIELRRIFKECEKFGRSTFTYPDKQKYTGIARSIGIKAKPLVTKGLMLPPANTRHHNVGIIALPINVEVKETKTKNGSIFKFRKNGGIW